jgi:hypothetical protein
MKFLTKKQAGSSNIKKLITHPKYQEAWLHSSANEFGRLAQGVGGRIKGNRYNFFHPQKSDSIGSGGRTSPTQSSVCELKPNKAEVHRTRLVVGGDKVQLSRRCRHANGRSYLGENTSQQRCFYPRSPVHDIGRQNFYLNTPMTRFEYVRISIDQVPQEIIDEYNLKEKVVDGYVYVEIRKGMYGLPQAGILAQQLLEERLNKNGYSRSKAMPGLWTHKIRPINSTLVVDDFGVKYVGKEHAMHLINILKEHYDISEDWTGSKYIGINFDWDYDNRRVHLSMPGYIDKALKRFGHDQPKRRKTHRIRTWRRAMEPKRNMLRSRSHLRH